MNDIVSAVPGMSTTGRGRAGVSVQGTFAPGGLPLGLASSAAVAPAPEVSTRYAAAVAGGPATSVRAALISAAAMT